MGILQQSAETPKNHRDRARPGANALGRDGYFFMQLLPSGVLIICGGSPPET
jgi:hypothetical protein